MWNIWKARIMWKCETFWNFVTGEKCEKSKNEKWEKC